MFRRCLTCVLDQIYKIGAIATRDKNEVYDLPRAAAEELVMASVLSFLAVSDLSARFSDEVFATDASLSKGAVCVRKVSALASRVLWLGGDKKGSYARLGPYHRELCKIVELDEEDLPELEADKTSIPQRLEFSFDFVEICAGVGSVSKSLARRGFQVCTPIELSDSPHFDVTKVEMLKWLACMMQSRRIRAIMVEPVCTTFSPAAHPSVRSYANPKGYDMTCEKTRLGNDVAFKCLYLLWIASNFDLPCLGEQPRLSKMAWLSIWIFLLEKKGFEESIVASCQFGSPHRKEFRLIGKNLDMPSLEVRCPGGHPHLRIQGKFTKKSAVYTPALADHIARAFATALRRENHLAREEVEVSGHESVVANDILTSGGWEELRSWTWRSPAHINILESHAYLALLRRQVLCDGDVRFTTLLDSRVAKGCHAKGRSSVQQKP